jgi:hypothetical protein
VAINDEQGAIHANHVRRHDNYLMCKKDRTRLRGFSSVQKCTTPLRCLAYVAHPDAQDDSLSMSESTAWETGELLCEFAQKDHQERDDDHPFDHRGHVIQLDQACGEFASF